MLSSLSEVLCSHCGMLRNASLASPLRRAKVGDLSGPFCPQHMKQAGPIGFSLSRVSGNLK